VRVAFGGVIFTPGAYLYADEDGIVVSEQALEIATVV
jgi:regulator of RNase E activity RraA